MRSKFHYLGKTTLIKESSIGVDLFATLGTSLGLGMKVLQLGPEISIFCDSGALHPDLSWRSYAYWYVCSLGN